MRPTVEADGGEETTLSLRRCVESISILPVESSTSGARDKESLTPATGHSTVLDSDITEHSRVHHANGPISMSNGAKDHTERSLDQSACAVDQSVEDPNESALNLSCSSCSDLSTVERALAEAEEKIAKLLRVKGKLVAMQVGNTLAFIHPN